MTSESASIPGSNREEPSAVSFGEALRLWVMIGWLSFGGPAGQIALMHRELVERRRWISESRFLHALNYCMLLPGPEAQQLATYIGWLLHRRLGGIVAGGLFVLPGMLVMLALSWLYVRYSSVGPVAAIFFGLKAAVLAVVIEALLRIGRRALKNRFMIGLAGASFIAIYFLRIPFPWIVATAALIGWVGSRIRPSFFSYAASADSEGDGDFLVDRMHNDGRLAHAQPDTRRALVLTVVCVGLATGVAPSASSMAACSSSGSTSGSSFWSRHVQLGLVLAEEHNAASPSLQCPDPSTGLV